MIKTVIFDFDGTLADTFPTILDLFNQYAKDFGLPRMNKLEIEKLRNFGLKEIIEKFGFNVIKIPFIAKKIRDELNNQMTSVKLFPKINEVLKKLRENEFQLGILSSNSKENIEKLLINEDLMIFDFIHSENSLLGKSEALKNLVIKYKFNKDEVIYIGDEVRDIEACKENMIKIIAVTWGFNKKEILQKNNPDYLIDKPEEILEVI